MGRDGKIKVLIIDGCSDSREVLVKVLEADSDISVIGTTDSGEQALDFLAKHKPDIVTTDIKLPGMDGLETTSKIMKSYPLPIVVITSMEGLKDRQATLRSLSAGAMTVLAKPRPAEHAEFDKDARSIVNMVKELSEVKIMTRQRSSSTNDTHSTDISQRVAKLSKSNLIGTTRIIAIGASTGGPAALKSILAQLPSTWPLPIVVAQHIVPGFAEALVSFLDQSCQLAVQLVSDNATIQPGNVYIIPTEGKPKIGRRGKLQISEIEDTDNSSRSIDDMFDAISEAYGDTAIGILLTGMGKDGAAGLARMRVKGAMTIAQDEESSIVFGMPGEAVKLGAAEYLLSPHEIVDLLLSHAKTLNSVPK